MPVAHASGTSHLNGSVKIEADQIKLFTNDHRQKTLDRLQQRLQQFDDYHHFEVEQLQENGRETRTHVQTVEG